MSDQPPDTRLGRIAGKLTDQLDLESGIRAVILLDDGQQGISVMHGWDVDSEDVKHEIVKSLVMHTSAVADQLGIPFGTMVVPDIGAAG